MTPTEQDKELTKAIYEAMQVPYLSERHDAIKRLVIADRKRVALEARIDELTQLSQSEVMFFNNDYKQAKLIRDRIAELKAQQEEV